IGAYIYKAYINDRYYINYADASAKLNPDAGLIFRYGQATNDSIMTGFGSYLAAQQNWKEQLPTETIEATLENALVAPMLLQTPVRKPLLADWWMPGTQIMAARDQAGSTDGFYFSALGGHNAESHNHNDVGSCIVFYNGQPVLIDIGSETYTRQTFGPERYSIWTMQSAWHNLPLINGVMQKEGAAYKAVNPIFTASKKTVRFSLDIAAAYPAAAAVKKWERTYLLTRGQQLSITDNYELQENNGNTALHFMTSLPAELVNPGQIRFPLASGTLALDYNPQQLEATLEPVAVKDKRLLQSWPATVYRIVLKVKSGERKGKIELKIKKA
ncbi:MAG: heparinase II/III family protein, partial [Chitinophagaceae bacterium]|nr:heparinase II/III family protein [Chitinophagaceae bacterium]